MPKQAAPLQRMPCHEVIIAVVLCAIVVFASSWVLISIASAIGIGIGVPDHARHDTATSPQSSFSEDIAKLRAAMPPGTRRCIDHCADNEICNIRTGECLPLARSNCIFRCPNVPVCVPDYFKNVDFDCCGIEGKIHSEYTHTCMKAGKCCQLDDKVYNETTRTCVHPPPPEACKPGWEWCHAMNICIEPPLYSCCAQEHGACGIYASINGCCKDPGPCPGCKKYAEEVVSNL